MMELVDVADLKFAACNERTGSTPVPGTITKQYAIKF